MGAIHSMSVPFTQYIRPKGRHKIITIYRSPEVEEMAIACIDAGYGFEAEILSNGMVNLTAMFNGRTVAIAVGLNDADVPILVDKIITRAYRHLRE